ncbi:MAG: hypothetical protein M1396_05215 [Chloroflexi bacterium]|nr:hypothetical protein [Chloroflexota bacterium]
MYCHASNNADVPRSTAVQIIEEIVKLRTRQLELRQHVRRQKSARISGIVRTELEEVEDRIPVLRSLLRASEQLVGE